MKYCLVLLFLCEFQSLYATNETEGVELAQAGVEVAQAAVEVTAGPLEVAPAVDYCSIKTCGPRKHVMCRFKWDRPGVSCIRLQKGKEFSETEKKEILEAHNKLRSAVAIGAMEQRTPNGQQMPGAEDMYEVFWDDELAMFAQRWAKQCKVYAKDMCRNTEKFENVGQLLFKKKWNPSSALSFHVNRAYLKAGSASTVLPLLRKRAEKIPFREQRVVAQLVWGNVTKLGCARAVFQHDPTLTPRRKQVAKVKKKPKRSRSRRAMEPTELVVCNYNDGGQMRGQVYAEGKYCTYCFCSKVYDGLCTNAGAKMMSMISWVPVISLVWCL